MAFQPVRQKPDKVLKEKTPEFSDFKDPYLKELIKDMKDTLTQQNGAGIAAPQIGVSKRLFVIPKEYSPKIKSINRPLSFIRPFYPTVFINPKITYYSKETNLMHEGCLSIRDKFYDCPRSTKVTLEAQDEKGKKMIIKAEDFLAQIFQHETDHLDGILFIDRIYEKLKK